MPEDVPARFIALPARPGDFNSQLWEALAPYFDELAAATLTASNVEAWLGQWSALLTHLFEAESRLYNDSACDAADKAKEAAYLNYFQVIGPRVEEAWQGLRRKLLDSGLKPAGMEQAYRRFGSDADLYREENLPLKAELAGLEHDCEQIFAAWSADFEGEKRSRAFMTRATEDPDRGRRERAWRAMHEAHTANRDALDGLFDGMLARRHRLGLNAGFDGYTPYRFREMGRLDWTPEDCFRFHEAIGRTAVPLQGKLAALWARELGVEVMLPWDANANPFGTPEPLGAGRMEAGVSAMLAKVAPATHRHFERMRSRRSLDLEDRPGKRYAGFCSPLPLSDGAFIFMNATGSSTDVETLAHEAGHAMHFMEFMETQPWSFQWFPGAECSEMVAMSHEFRVLDHLEALYPPADAARVRLNKLASIPAGFSAVAICDAFQHWVYAHPGADAAARRARCLALVEAYSPPLPPGDLFKASRETLWQRVHHLFGLPHYYVEYGFARRGALEVWRRSRADPAGAGADLLRAMRSGGTLTSRDFFRLAGADLRFDAEHLGALLAWVEAEIERSLKELGLAPLP